jgi:ribonuclease P/MRP protein subunit POP5
VKYISPSTSTAILRVSRSHYRLIWAALSFITKLPSPSSNSHNSSNIHSSSRNSTGQDFRSNPTEQNSRPCVIQVIRISGTIKKAEEEAIRQARAVIARARRAAGRGGGKGVGIGGLGGEGGAVVEEAGIESDDYGDGDDDDEDDGGLREDSGDEGSMS